MKNIKLIVFILLIVGISTNTYAGDKIGFRAGYQYANIYNGSSSLNGGLSSFYLGIFKEKKLFPLLKIGTGLEYSQAGTSMDSDNQLRLHTIAIPVYARLKLGPVYALAGGAPSFKVGETWETESVDFTKKDNFDGKTFDFPVFAGLGFKILMLRIEARYYLGTMDISGNAALEGYKNQYLQVGLALSI